MEWRIHDSHARMRVLLMVSNFDHCLEDLLYRHRIGELKMAITASCPASRSPRPATRPWNASIIARPPEPLVAVGRHLQRRARSTAVRYAIEHRIFLNGSRTVVFK